MDLKEIQNLIKFVSNSGVAEVKLEMDDVKITIKTTVEGTSPEITYLQQAPIAQAAPQAAPAPVSAAPVAAASAAENSNYITVKSPMIGTFYRKPSPDKQCLLKLEAQFQKEIHYV